MSVSPLCWGIELAPLPKRTAIQRSENGCPRATESGERSRRRGGLWGDLHLAFGGQKKGLLCPRPSRQDNTNTRINTGDLTCLRESSYQLKDESGLDCRSLCRRASKLRGPLGRLVVLTLAFGKIAGMPSVVRSGRVMNRNTMAAFAGFAAA
jgi:hypothetical protein